MIDDRDDQHIPQSPFPGLRPFVDTESKLFFGRDRQIREITRRLEKSHSVAVLGGSGSGKSSLVRAGVIPRLRQYGILEAGQSWLPIVFTPGSNFENSFEDGPYHRLVRQLLSHLDLSQIEQATEKEITREIIDLLHSVDGLSDFIDEYAQFLKVEPGINKENVNFLFVFDQFEEVFHTSNAAHPDIKSFVEKLLIGHCKNHHERAFVVLTMRSEHLNDCAQFLELPNVINNSGYLIGRLTPHEIKEAIVMPLKKYLRILTRANFEFDERYPVDIEIDEGMLRIIINEVAKLSNKADHLPLMQHLLYRMWQVAMQRVKAEQSQYLVPEKIIETDLRAAIGIQEGENFQDILETCLDYWANDCHNKLQNNPINQLPIERFFKSLGYVDHNGKYSQRRVKIEDAKKTLGVTLYKEVVDVFTKPHSYLYIDEPDIKVSHESFIREWETFKAWIDEDSVDIKQYKYLWEKFVRWSTEGADDLKKFSGPKLLFKKFKNWQAKREKLLPQSDIKSETTKSLQKRIRDPFQEEQIQQKILQSGEKNNKIFDLMKQNRISVNPFISKSNSKATVQRRLFWALIILMVPIPFVIAAFWNYVQESKMHEDYFKKVDDLAYVATSISKPQGYVYSDQFVYDFLRISNSFLQSEQERIDSTWNFVVDKLNITGFLDDKIDIIKFRTESKLRDFLSEHINNTNFVIAEPNEIVKRKLNAGKDIVSIKDANCQPLLKEYNDSELLAGTIVYKETTSDSVSGMNNNMLPAFFIRKSSEYQKSIDKSRTAQDVDQFDFFFGEHEVLLNDFSNKMEKSFKKNFRNGPLEDGLIKYELFSAIVDDGQCYFIEEELSPINSYIAYVLKSDITFLIDSLFSSFYLILPGGRDEENKTISEIREYRIDRKESSIVLPDSAETKKVTIYTIDNESSVKKFNLKIDYDDLNDVLSESFISKSKNDELGKLIEIGNHVVRHTNFTTRLPKFNNFFPGDRSADMKNSPDWIKLQEINKTELSKFKSCHEWNHTIEKDMEDYSSKSDPVKIYGSMNEEFCVSVSKNLVNSKPKWTIVVYNNDSIKANGSSFVTLSDFPVSDYDAFYIGKQDIDEKQDVVRWFGAGNDDSETVRPERIRPIGYHLIHNNTQQLCNELGGNECYKN